ncbi:MAG: hypothetical protein JXB46_03325, partial [Candidatus Eisenbacteria bacterium]|nr:hypothetical protein [Candidatus Eisenbacteria bacterium]
AAVRSFMRGMPLEDLVNPAAAARPFLDVNRAAAEPDLRVFLHQPQTGARRVAKALFRVVSEERSMQHSAAVQEKVRLHEDTVFPVLPVDTGHFAQPYYPFVLRGLRSRIPPYVSDVLADQPLPPEITNLVDGIVVVRC